MISDRRDDASFDFDSLRHFIIANWSSKARLWECNSIPFSCCCEASSIGLEANGPPIRSVLLSWATVNRTAYISRHQSVSRSSDKTKRFTAVIGWKRDVVSRQHRVSHSKISLLLSRYRGHLPIFPELRADPCGADGRLVALISILFTFRTWVAKPIWVLAAAYSTQSPLLGGKSEESGLEWAEEGARGSPAEISFLSLGHPLYLSCTLLH